ncbi:MAG: hypothetical protein AAF756_03515 [Pseudomonadota bacterium]
MEYAIAALVGITSAQVFANLVAARGFSPLKSALLGFAFCEVVVAVLGMSFGFWDDRSDLLWGIFGLHVCLPLGIAGKCYQEAEARIEEKGEGVKKNGRAD